MILFVVSLKFRINIVCCQFLLGLTIAPREIENNAYANFWRENERILWYFFKRPILVVVAKCRHQQP